MEPSTSSGEASFKFADPSGLLVSGMVDPSYMQPASNFNIPPPPSNSSIALHLAISKTKCELEIAKALKAYTDETSLKVTTIDIDINKPEGSLPLTYVVVVGAST